MKLKKLMMIGLTATTLLTACGSGASTTATEATTEEAPKETTVATAEPASTEKTEVLFWHSMGGTNQEILENIVKDFNASQDKYTVNAQNQGTYDESTSKFFNMGNESGRPAMIQIGEQNLQSMVDSEMIFDVNELIEEFNYPKEELVPGVVNFYSLDNKLYAMPFNASSPVIYYNADALKAASVEVPKTFQEILDSSEPIKATNNGMKPFSMTAYGYAIDQMVTNLDGFIINNDNGRADRATEVAYQPQLKIIYDFIATLVANGDFINYGRSTDNMIAGFNNLDVAMIISTSAYAKRIVDSAPFEVGIAYLPTVEGVEAQGVYAGGGAICVAENLSPEEKEGVMEFLKYGTSAEVQANWAGDTGYFPINNKSYETETMNKIYTETPALKVAADQFKNSKQTPKTAGPLLSQLPQLRNDLMDAIELVFNGGDVDAAIEQAAKNTNSKIETANKSIGQ